MSPTFDVSWKDQFVSLIKHPNGLCLLSIQKSNLLMGLNGCVFLGGDLKAQPAYNLSTMQNACLVSIPTLKTIYEMDKQRVNPTSGEGLWATKGGVPATNWKFLKSKAL